jgi:hypothetical protein
MFDDSDEIGEKTLANFASNDEFDVDESQVPEAAL